jgi:predicted RNase H-like nuclease
MKVVGIDLAWQSAKNTSAAAIGRLEGDVLAIEALREDLDSVEAIIEFATRHDDIVGIAIDAPLIINNAVGQRSCERQLSRAYGARKASCHTSNLGLYPDPPSVELANALAKLGFVHLGRPGQSHWQIECYPHPAIIEIFGLQERHQYKKGSAAQKREGQIALAKLLQRLAKSPVLKLHIDERLSSYLSESEILSKRGRALKKNEDALDAIACAYIAGLYALGAPGAVFGDAQEGYIYVPQVCCLEPGLELACAGFEEADGEQ